MSITRREFIYEYASLGSGFLMIATGCSSSRQELAEDFEPASTIQWLGDSFLWIGAIKSDHAPRFAVIRKQPRHQASFVAPVGGPNLCRRGVEPHLYAQGLRINDTLNIVGITVQVVTLPDQGLALSSCQFADAREREKWEKRGFDDLTTVSIGPRVSKGGGPPKELVLACRPAKSNEASELLLFGSGDSDTPLRTTVDIPLALDNPILIADPITGHWLAYPSFTFKRRQALKNSLPGIPVCRVTSELDVSLAWVPWAEWNLNGPYRFFPLKTGFIGAMSLGWSHDGIRLSGIYILDHSRWERRFAGQVDISSLAVSADQHYLAWSEQIKVVPPNSLYGKLRQVVRIEPIQPVEPIWQKSNNFGVHYSS